MRRTTTAILGLLVAALIATPASAAPPTTGSTDLLDPPTSGTTMAVEVSVSSSAPVVPYEYAIQNECQLPNKGARTVQRDDIVGWTFEDGGVPHAVMPVYLQAIPAGSKCKVYLVRGNTTVKGSVTSYTVMAP